MKTVKFKNWKCRASLTKYQGNDATAITLVDAEDESPVATCTVNIVKEHYHPDLHNEITFSGDLPKNQCYIKTWSENNGMIESLMEAGIVKPEGSGIDVNGQGAIAVLVDIIDHNQ
jgi:hypothetical protein